MIRNLIQTGNSKALILTKDMRDHLGVDDVLEVEFRKNSIILRHPDVEVDEDGAANAKPKEKVKEKPKEVKEPKEKAKEKGKDKEKSKDKAKKVK